MEISIQINLENHVEIGGSTTVTMIWITCYNLLMSLDKFDNPKYLTISAYLYITYITYIWNAEVHLLMYNKYWYVDMIFCESFKTYEYEICWHGSGYNSQRLDGLDMDWSYLWISALVQRRTLQLVSNWNGAIWHYNIMTPLYIISGRSCRPKEHYSLSYLGSVVCASFSAPQNKYIGMCQLE